MRLIQIAPVAMVATLLAACQPASEAKPDDPRIAYYEEVAGLGCNVVYDGDGQSAGNTSFDVTVYNYTPIGNDWTRIDASVQGLRFNIYHKNGQDGGVVCGDPNWQKVLKKYPDLLSGPTTNDAENA